MNLYDFVKTYSEFGCHRTGSEEQLATEKWLVDYLDLISDEIIKFDYPYHHFQAETKVRIEGRLIPSMPLYYEAIGEIHGSSHILTSSIKVTENESQAYREIKNISSEAKKNGYKVIIIATKGKTDSLYALNVTPQLKDTIPVILVPGYEAQKLQSGNLAIDYSASVCEQTGQNIIARFGHHFPESAVIVTTPMTGWFSCAAERGTGLALAIELANFLGDSMPVELVLTSAHELGYLGGFQFANSLDKPPAAVIHIGSCVGAKNPTMNAWCNSSSVIFDEYKQLLKKFHISTTSVTNPLSSDSWIGEAECWAQFGCPMISMAGSTPSFHTPEDKWQNAATEQSLDEMRSVLKEIGRQAKKLR